MEQTGRMFLPPAGHRWLLPLYDPCTRLLGVDNAHRRLLDQANIRPRHHVLDIGCGTGNLAMLVKKQCPGAKVVGLDPDGGALARARRKAEKSGLDVEFSEGFADQLSYPDGCFDRVLSAFMFHHLLEVEDKIKTLREARRALAPGGSLHLVDFGGAEGHSDGLVARLLHRSERLRDNRGDRIPMLMREAGLSDPTEVGHQRLSILGRIAYYAAYSPHAARQRPRGGAQ